jgi:ethanolamine ammonia-lyase large subunit
LFDVADSTTYHQQKLEEDTIFYNTGSISGYLSTERVCLSDNSTYCTDDQQFIAVTETQGLDFLQSDGILGLAPTNNIESTYNGTGNFI